MSLLIEPRLRQNPRTMSNNRHEIDLTGPRSHTLVIEPGVGSLTVGPASLGKKADLHVGPDERIDWTVFNAFTTPAGYPWPRVVRYTGGDTGFFDWARDRPIEQMAWVPILPADTTIDASAAQVQSLSIELDQPGAHIYLSLPKTQAGKYFRLSVKGDVARFSAAGSLPSWLELTPHTSPRRNNGSYQLPEMGVLHQVATLALKNGPLRQPISLQCLSRFPNLESLSLWGNFCDLEQLARLPRLKSLELRFMPDLNGLPALNTWPDLDGFIAFNIEETAGKRLRQQLKSRAAVRAWAEHSSVTQLRKPEWWSAEFGRPFSAWPARLAKLANETYDAAQAALAKARTIADAEAAFTAFTVRFNKVESIQTTERDDLGEAVWQLSQSGPMTKLGVTEEMAQRWFDKARDY